MEAKGEPGEAGEERVLEEGMGEEGVGSASRSSRVARTSLLPTFPTRHSYLHALVRCGIETVKTSQLDDDSEDKSAAMTERVGQLEQNVHKIDSKLTNVVQYLQLMMGKMGWEG